MSVEGFAILAFVYFVLNRIAKAGKQARGRIDAAREQLSDREPDQDPGEGLSLEKVLREIERVKAEAEQARRAAARPRLEPVANRPKGIQAPRRLSVPGDPTRGPLGRVSRQTLDITPERGSLEVEERVVDQDDEAQAVIQRRLEAVANRTREGREASYQARQKAEAAAVASEALTAAAASARLRRAIVWREILGPPVALRGQDE